MSKKGGWKRVAAPGAVCALLALCALVCPEQSFAASGDRFTGAVSISGTTYDGTSEGTYALPVNGTAGETKGAVGVLVASDTTDNVSGVNISNVTVQGYTTVVTMNDATNSNGSNAYGPMGVYGNMFGATTTEMSAGTQTISGLVLQNNTTTFRDIHNTPPPHNSLCFKRPKTTIGGVSVESGKYPYCSLTIGKSWGIYNK